jgi:hypothetical protein
MVNRAGRESVRFGHFAVFVIKFKGFDYDLIDRPYPSYL